MAVIPRFYTPNTPFVPGEKALLTPEARHHAGRVLRMVAGDTAALFDGVGRLATGPIAFGGTDAWITVQSVSTPAVESPVELTLVQALVSPEKLDWIVEKAVELGVRRLFLAPAERSVTKLSGDRLEKRLRHARDVIVSACEQSGRCVVPELLYFPTLEKALTSVSAERRLFLAPSATRAALAPARSMAFAVGPEGGFSQAEIALAETLGWTCTLLGRRVLRTETAGLAALAAAQTVAGDFA